MSADLFYLIGRADPGVWGEKDGCMSHGLAVFFDSGDTPTAAVMPGGRLDRLDAFHFVPEICHGREQLAG